MGFMGQMFRDLTTGSRDQKVTAGTAVVSWFAMGAFVCSVLAYYVDLATAAHLPQMIIALLGGVVSVAIAVKVA